MPSQITRCSHNASVLSKRIHDDLATRALGWGLPLAYIDHPVFFAPLPQPKLGLFDSREACYFLSEDLMSLPYEECFQIALHEAAHAAAFHTTGTLAHDEVFRSWCKALGADEAYSKAKVNMKTRSGLLDKIRKLEALSSSPFAAESEAAMRKVRELMASHKLEDDMEEEEAIYMVDLCPALSRISTRWTMLTAIASMQTGAYLVKVKDGDGYCIRATDIDRKALRRASERTGLDIFSYLDADGPIPYTDQLLMVFFGHIGSAAELDGYLSRCRRMAMVISHHRGQGFQTRESRRARLLGILREAGCAYDEEELALSFDQPLDSREDAMAFVRTCYPAECQERVLSMVEEGTASPYILRNRKMMSIFTIYGKEGR